MFDEINAFIEEMLYSLEIFNIPKATLSNKTAEDIKQ